MCWIIENLDRVLALVAILIATYAIWDVHKLFQELERRDKDTERKVRMAVLKELLTFTASFATFSRAAQFIDFFPSQPDRETSIAMLSAFKIQQLIAPDAKAEELAELRRTTRNQIEEAARGYAESIIATGLGKMKGDWEIGPSPK